MKKLSPEFRVGLIAIVILALFIWLFSFLKGRNLFNTYDHYHIKYENIAGLEPSSPVEISGLKAGIVNSVNLVNDGSGIIDVMISIENNYRISENSIAEITTATLIAGMKINLILGDSNTMLQSGDTIKGRLAVSIINKLNESFDPIVMQAQKLIGNIDTLVSSLNGLFTPEFSGKLNQSVANLEKSSSNFSQLLENNSDDINKLIANLTEISEMLESNTENFDSTIIAVSKITKTINKADLDSSLHALQLSLENSSRILDKLNKGNGSAGKILNNDSLYLNLNNSLKSLDILLKDIENNPGKYVHFSIFGKKKE